MTGEAPVTPRFVTVIALILLGSKSQNKKVTLEEICKDMLRLQKEGTEFGDIDLVSWRDYSKDVWEHLLNLMTSGRIEGFPGFNGLMLTDDGVAFCREILEEDLKSDSGDELVAIAAKLGAELPQLLA